MRVTPFRVGRRRYKVTGNLGISHTSWRPAVIRGVQQNGGPILPPCCTKCEAPWFTVTAWTAHCILCGRRWFRTLGERDQPDRTMR